MLELASVATHQPCVDADDVFIVLNIQRTCRVVVVCCSQDTSNVLSDQSLSTDNVPLIVDKCIDFIATYGNSVQMLLVLFVQTHPCIVIMLIGICKFTLMRVNFLSAVFVQCYLFKDIATIFIFIFNCWCHL